MEFQDSRQKWRTTGFRQKVPDDSTGNLGAKNIVKIPLSGTVSEALKMFHFQH